MMKIEAIIDVAFYRDQLENSSLKAGLDETIGSETDPEKLRKICAKHYREKGLQAGYSFSLFFDAAYYAAQLNALRQKASQRTLMKSEAIHCFLDPQDKQADLMPRPFFDAVFYRAQLSETERSELITNRDLFCHFITQGEAKGLSPTPIFDVRYYTWQVLNSSMVLPVDKEKLKNGETSAIKIFLADQYKNMSPSPFFDEDFYEGTTGEKPFSNKLEAVEHFLSIGLKKGFSPSQFFNIAHYAKLKALDNKEAFQFFILKGEAQGDVPSPLFDTPYYLSQLEDDEASSIQSNHLSAFRHFLLFGKSKGYFSTPLLDPQYTSFFDIHYYWDQLVALKLECDHLLMSENANFSEIPEKFIFGYVFCKNHDKIELFYYNKAQNNGIPLKLGFQQKSPGSKTQEDFDVFLREIYKKSPEKPKIIPFSDNDFQKITLFTAHTLTTGVTKEEIPLKQHFLIEGQSRGLNPSHLFDVRYYALVANVEKKYALQDYLVRGKALGLKPSPFTSPEQKIEKIKQWQNHFRNNMPEIMDLILVEGCSLTFKIDIDGEGLSSNSGTAFVVDILLNYPTGKSAQDYNSSYTKYMERYRAYKRLERLQKYQEWNPGWAKLKITISNETITTLEKDLLRRNESTGAPNYEQLAKVFKLFNKMDRLIAEGFDSAASITSFSKEVFIDITKAIMPNLLPTVGPNIYVTALVKKNYETEEFLIEEEKDLQWEDTSYRDTDVYKIFDLEFYLAQLPEVTSKMLKLLNRNIFRHFMTEGEMQGYSPSPIFDVDFYTQQLSSEDKKRIESGETSAIQLFLANESYTYSPSPFFDYTFYKRKANDSRLTSVKKAMLHFVTTGLTSALDPAPFFDLANYKQNYKREDNQSFASYKEALCFFVLKGEFRSDLPSPLFDREYYLSRLDEEEANSIRTGEISALRHYLVVGYRQKDLIPIPLFDEEHYTKQKAEVGFSAIQHYFLNYSENKDIAFSPYFDKNYYQAQIDALMLTNEIKSTSYADLVMHFIQKGQARGLNPSYLFDVRYYALSTGVEKKYALQDYLMRGKALNLSLSPFYDTDQKKYTKVPEDISKWQKNYRNNMPEIMDLLLVEEGCSLTFMMDSIGEIFFYGEDYNKKKFGNTNTTGTAFLCDLKLNFPSNKPVQAYYATYPKLLDRYDAYYRLSLLQDKKWCTESISISRQDCLKSDVSSEMTTGSFVYDRINTVFRLFNRLDSFVQAGIDSAVGITSFSEEAFKQKMLALMPKFNGSYAPAIYKTALDRTANVSLNYLSAYQSLSPYVNNRSFSINTTSYSDYQSLFGALDYYNTDPNISIYSPAAYFFDLMRITNDLLSPYNRKNLMRRRPDLYEIPLDAKHAFNKVIYLEIVNYVLARQYLYIQDNISSWRSVNNNISSSNQPAITNASSTSSNNSTSSTSLLDQQKRSLKLASGVDFFISGQYIDVEQPLTSKNGQYFMKLERNGILQVFKKGIQPNDLKNIWCSPNVSSSEGDYFASIWGDGVLRVFKRESNGTFDSNAPKWSSSSSMENELHGATSFVMLQDNGDLCIYKGTGPYDQQKLLWNTGVNVYETDTLACNQYLKSGQYLVSSNKECFLILRNDGLLRLYHGAPPSDSKSRPIWDVGNRKETSNYLARMDNDGVLRIYRRSGSIGIGEFIWMSNQPQPEFINQECFAMIHNNGDFCTYKAAGVLTDLKNIWTKEGWLDRLNAGSDLPANVPPAYIPSSSPPAANVKIDRLTPGQYLVSTNNKYFVTLSKQGKLSVYAGNNPDDQNKKDLKEYGGSQTDFDKCHAIMQKDGNLVVYRDVDEKTVAWASFDKNPPGGEKRIAIITNRGNLSIYGSLVGYNNTNNASCNNDSNQDRSWWSANPQPFIEPVGFAPPRRVGNVSTSTSIHFFFFGQHINVGQSLTSQNGQYRMELGSNGVLRVYKLNPQKTIWFSHNSSSGEGDYFAGLWGYGELKIHKRTNTPKQGDFNWVPEWVSSPPGRGGDIASFVILQDNGDLCVYRGTGPFDRQELLWNTGVNVDVPTYMLASNQYINSGQYLISSQSQYFMLLGDDGILRVYRGRNPEDPDKCSVWSSPNNTPMQGKYFLMMGSDGVLSIRKREGSVGNYDKSKLPVWQSTQPTPSFSGQECFVMLHDNGNFGVYTKGIDNVQCIWDAKISDTSPTSTLTAIVTSPIKIQQTDFFTSLPIFKNWKNLPREQASYEEKVAYAESQTFKDMIPTAISSLYFSPCVLSFEKMKIYLNHLETSLYEIYAAINAEDNEVLEWEDYDVALAYLNMSKVEVLWIKNVLTAQLSNTDILKQFVAVSDETWNAILKGRTFSCPLKQFLMLTQMTKEQMVAFIPYTEAVQDNPLFYQQLYINCGDMFAPVSMRVNYNDKTEVVDNLTIDRLKRVLLSLFFSQKLSCSVVEIQPLLSLLRMASTNNNDLTSIEKDIKLMALYHWMHKTGGDNDAIVYALCPLTTYRYQQRFAVVHAEVDFSGENLANALKKLVNNQVDVLTFDEMACLQNTALALRIRYTDFAFMINAALLRQLRTNGAIMSWFFRMTAMAQLSELTLSQLLKLYHLVAANEASSYPNLLESFYAYLIETSYGSTYTTIDKIASLYSTSLWMKKNNFSVDELYSVIYATSTVYEFNKEKECLKALSENLQQIISEGISQLSVSAASKTLSSIDVLVCQQLVSYFGVDFPTLYQLFDLRMDFQSKQKNVIIQFIFNNSLLLNIGTDKEKQQEDLEQLQKAQLDISAMRSMQCLAKLSQLFHLSASNENTEWSDIQVLGKLLINNDVLVISLDTIKTLVQFKALQKNFKDNANQFLCYYNAAQLDIFLSSVKWNGEIYNQLKSAGIVSLPKDTLKIGDKVREIYWLSQLYGVIHKINSDTPLFSQFYTTNKKYKDIAAIDSAQYYDDYLNLSNKLAQMIQYRDVKGTEVLYTLSRSIEMRKRDILVARLLDVLNQKNPDKNKYLRASDISTHILLDVESDGILDTSLISQGINALQLYLQRCRLGVDGVSINIPDKWWPWLENYRLWEANRKILIYPENYIDPSLRTQQSNEFKTLMQSLAQGHWDQEGINDALREYFQNLVKFSNLVYVDACQRKKTDHKYTIYLFACTSTTPMEYYYRTVDFELDGQKNLDESQMDWGYWNKINTAINAALISPIYAHNRLFIFWVETKYKQYRGDTVENNAVTKKSNITEIDYKVLYTYQQNNGTWQMPQTVLERNNKNPADFFGAASLSVDYINNYYVQLGDKVARLNKVIVKFDCNQVFIQYPGSEFDSNLTSAEQFCLNKDLIVFKSSLSSLPPRTLTDRYNHLLLAQYQSSGGNTKELSPPSELRYKIKSEQLGLKDDGMITYADKVDVKGDDDAQKLFFLSQQNFAYLINPKGTSYYHYISLSSFYAINALNRRLYLGNFGDLCSMMNDDLEENFEQVCSPQNSTVVKYNRRTTQAINFDGHFGHYYWEIFFFAPFYIANQLNVARKYMEARDWYHYIFYPYNTSGVQQQYAFRFPPFQITEILNNSITYHRVLEASQNYAFDPHAIAKQRPLAYMKAVVMAYIKNLIDWADALFLENTRESTNLAINFYRMADDLLGQKPESLGARDASKQAITLAHYYDDTFPQNPICSAFNRDTLKIFQYLENKENSGSIPTLDLVAAHFYDLNPYFSIPENTDFMAYWDRIADRLFKIRHSLSMSGVKQSLPLFSAALNVNQLVRAAAANGLSMNDIFNNKMQVPVYRFSVQMEYAKSIISQVIQLGNALMSMLERHEAEKLSLIFNRHQVALLNLVITSKEYQITLAQGDVEQAESDIKTTEGNIKYYKELIDAGLLSEEKHAQNLKKAAIAFNTAATACTLASAISFLIPSAESGFNVVGPKFTLKYGGENIGGSLGAWSGFSSGIAGLLEGGADGLLNSAEYQWREREWKQQLGDAEGLLDDQKRQLALANIRLEMAKNDLAQHRVSIQHQEEVNQFYQEKFTGVDLYQWMISRLMSLHKQAYDMAFSTALAAERAYHYEVNDTALYFTSGCYDFARKGLLAGESLMLKLMCLEKAFLDKNKRSLEMTKTISLKKLGLDQSKELINELKNNSCVTFSLNDANFDEDFDDHENRRIRRVSVSVPGVTGPYQNMNFVLTQEGQEGCEGIPSEIVLTSEVHDTGTFDEASGSARYWPFEGTSVNSTWTLRLGNLNASGDVKKKKLDAISDVIMTIQYTAEKTLGKNKKAEENNTRSTEASNLDDLVVMQAYQKRNFFVQSTIIKNRDKAPTYLKSSSSFNSK